MLRVTDMAPEPAISLPQLPPDPACVISFEILGSEDDRQRVGTDFWSLIHYRDPAFILSNTVVVGLNGLRDFELLASALDQIVVMGNFHYSAFYLPEGDPYRWIFRPMPMDRAVELVA